jgi:hypothetical protein
MPLRQASNGFFFALWVAVCAASPEFVWQGLVSVFSHFSLRDAAVALLIGAILAFFVEPVLERVRSLGDAPHARKSPAFAACEALSFAVVAVCVHEAITVYIAASHSNEQASENLVKAVSQALQWAAIPFFITLAWMAARGPKWLAWTAVAIVVIASYLTGVIFEWAAHSLLTSAIPSLMVLAAGCVIVREQWDVTTFRRCARATAVIGAAWLALAGALQLALWAANVQAFRVYEWPEFWSDMRFYIGWVIGLFVAPPLVMATPAPVADDRWRRRK